MFPFFPVTASERVTTLHMAENTKGTGLTWRQFESEGEDDELEEEDSLSSENEIYDELLPEAANSGLNFPDIREKLCNIFWKDFV